MKDIDKLAQECQSRLAQGASRNDLVVFMHKHDATIIESIKILRLLLKIPLNEAKVFVASNAVWNAMAKTADQLHAQIETQVVGRAKRHVARKSGQRVRAIKAEPRRSRTRT